MITRRRWLRPRAFSLIEVLIAITVLALGLLGLGMVFPVVVRQQRTAQDSIQGLSAARSAGEYVRARDGMIDALLLVGQQWYSNDGHSTVAGIGQYDGGWLVSLAKVGNATFVTDATTGMVSVGDTNAAKTQFITVSDRLSPAPFVSSGGPQFVWDFAVRVPGSGQVQVALFSRRIDAGIRIPTAQGGTIKTLTLSHVLTGEPLGKVPYLCSPVAVNKSGRPTLTGVDQNGARNYALLRIIAPVTRDASDPPEMIRLSAADATLLDLARQPGQKLVDNSGVIHTVLRAADKTPNGVIVDKPLTDEQVFAMTSGKVQFLMTPQVPAAVTVATLQN